MAQKCASPGIVLAYVRSERAADGCECGECHGIEIRREMREKLGRELEQTRDGRSMLGEYG